jgi:hypothetical protein
MNSIGQIQHHKVPLSIVSNVLTVVLCFYSILQRRQIRIDIEVLTCLGCAIQKTAFLEAVFMSNLWQVLSVVAQQILSILRAITMGLQEFDFEGLY